MGSFLRFPPPCPPHVKFGDRLDSLVQLQRDYWPAGHLVFHLLDSKKQEALAELVLVDGLRGIIGVALPAKWRQRICRQYIVSLRAIRKKLLSRHNQAVIDSIIAWLELYKIDDPSLYLSDETRPLPDHERVLLLLEHRTDTEPLEWLIRGQKFQDLYHQPDQAFINLLTTLVLSELEQRIRGITIPEVAHLATCQSLMLELDMLLAFADLPEHIRLRLTSLRAWLSQYHDGHYASVA